MDINNYKLESTWNLWNHNLNDKSWKNDSYENIYSFENLYDIQLYTDILNITYLQNIRTPSVNKLCTHCLSK